MHECSLLQTTSLDFYFEYQMTTFTRKQIRIKFQKNFADWQNFLQSLLGFSQYMGNDENGLQTK